MANENELLALRSSNIEIEYDELLNLENSLENNGSIIFVVGKSPIDIMEPIFV